MSVLYFFDVNKLYNNYLGELVLCSKRKLSILFTELHSTIYQKVE